MIKTMTSAYITIDTEYSSNMVERLGPGCRAENFSRSISCITADGPAGVNYQLQQFGAHGLKAVFFVDPMPALIWGVEAISDIIGPILDAGQDVQLHLHTEWLELAGPANPLGTMIGRNMADFPFEEQCRLIDYARSVLMAAGAPAPVAFRAGNYGANDDSLRALAELGIAYDTSHTPGIVGGDCAISLGPEDRRPIEHCGVIEVPTGCIQTFGQDLRHAQITAISAREMLDALAHARSADITSFTMVSHSFELMCRNRERLNKVVSRRFDRLCAGLAAMPDVLTRTYCDNPPPLPATDPEPRPVLPLEPLRSSARVAEQIVSNMLYGS
ncbi:MAG: polysaccharide deacetylase family protein [Sphingomonadaceae bacterium]